MHYPDERVGDGNERGLQAPDGVERRDVRAGGGHQEDPERGAADLDAIPQRVGHAGQPDRPRRPHHHRAAARPGPMVTVAVAVVMVRVVAVAAVRAGDEEHGPARGVERRSSGGQGEEPGRGTAAVVEVREGWEAEEAS